MVSQTNGSLSGASVGVYLVKQVLRSKNKIRLLDYELVGMHTRTHTRTNIAGGVAIESNCVQSSSLSLRICMCALGGNTCVETLREHKGICEQFYIGTFLLGSHDVT